MLIIFLTLCVAAIQISDLYLKYLPFRDGVTDDERKLLRRGFLIYGIFCVLIYGAAFNHFGITAPLYKFFLMVCWIPCQAIFANDTARIFATCFYFGNGCSLGINSAQLGGDLQCNFV